jgi:predicted nucleic acid-binding protein
MPRSYFVDAWCFIALVDRRDSHHQRATRLIARLRGATLVTHQAIFHEVLAYFSDAGPQARAAAVDVVRRAQSGMTVVVPEQALFARAVDRYAQRADKQYSLTDCMSMILMEARRITDVLTNDHHFREEGFTVVGE